jgi:hypothetical protein
MTRTSVSLLAALTVAGVIALSIWLSRWLATTTTQIPNYAPPPGAINPQVTQANIAETICVRGWTHTVRPTREYTSALKRQQMAERHLPGRPSDYKLDHFIPMDLGGAPRDLRNLWPEPRPQARLKDREEYALNRAVCSGWMTLGVAQQKIKDPQGWR